MKLHKRALAPVRPYARFSLDLDLIPRRSSYLSLLSPQTMSPSFLAFASTIFSQNLEVLIQLWHLRLTIAQKGGEGADLFWNAEEDLHSLTTVRRSLLSAGPYSLG